MQVFSIRALTEIDLDGIVNEVGGRQAHPDADRRNKVGADYVIGDTVIELKMLNDEGFNKPERQAKLADLFRASQPDRPVVVIDSNLLPEAAKRRYRNIIEQPIKGVVAKSRQQLAQSRTEYPETKGSVLWIVNNGYTALDHDTLEELVTNRVRQDTSAIDGVIISGCYYHSDGFDSFFLWPCSYLPIRVGSSFPEFSQVQGAFYAFANNYMTELMCRDTPSGDKLEVRDLTFDLDGVTFVRPAPVMGHPSDFYIKGRPRANSSGIENCPAVALVVPRLTRNDHTLIAEAADELSGPLTSWQAWQSYIDGARQAAEPTMPLVAIPVAAQVWLKWCEAENEPPSLANLTRFVLELFEERIRVILTSATERTDSGITPSVYILAVTQEIGQDRANDVSDIAFVRERANAEPIIRPLVENLRIFHEHAVALAAAYALRGGLDIVQWNKNRRHAWV